MTKEIKRKKKTRKEVNLEIVTSKAFAGNTGPLELHAWKHGEKKRRAGDTEGGLSAPPSKSRETGG